MYIHELDAWPKFHWRAETIAAPLASVRDRQSRLLRHMEALGFTLQQEAVLQTLTADVLKSSEIEGEKLDAGQVHSSIARRLGIDISALTPTDRNVEGVVEMMLDATRQLCQVLTGHRSSRHPRTDRARRSRSECRRRPQYELFAQSITWWRPQASPQPRRRIRTKGLPCWNSEAIETDKLDSLGGIISSPGGE
jgi:hypothetical protein